MKKYQEKQNKTKVKADNEEAEAKQDDKDFVENETSELKKQRLLQGHIKEDSQIPDYWRYVAIVLLALYFLKDYIFE